MREAFLECKVLSQKIVEFKKKNKLTYQQIGDALGVDKSYINRVVKLDSYPSLPVMIRLAKFMRVPLYSLFLPSDSLVRQEFVDTAKEKITASQLTFDQLGEKSGLSPIRLMEIFDGKAEITNEERSILSSVLDIPEDIFHQEDKVSLLESLMSGMGLQDSQKDTVIKYIKDNLR